MSDSTIYPRDWKGYPTDWTGELIIAVNEGNHARADEALEKGADISVVNGRPLCIAIQKHDGVMVQLLLGHGADLYAINQYGELPVVRAAHEGDVEIMRLLINHGANPHEQNEYAFRTAVVKKNLGMLYLLYRYSPDPCTCSDAAIKAVHFLLEANKSLHYEPPDEERNNDSEIMAMIVGLAGPEREGLYRKHQENFKAQARLMGSLMGFARKKPLFEPDGSANSFLRQFALARVLPAMFEPEHFQTPDEAREFYSQVKKALPEILRPALEGIDKTSFAAGAENMVVKYAERSHLSPSFRR